MASSSSSSAAFTVLLPVVIWRIRLYPIGSGDTTLRAHDPPRDGGDDGESISWTDGAPGLGDRLRLLGDRRWLRADRPDGVRPGRRTSPRPRHHLLRYR